MADVTAAQDSMGLLTFTGAERIFAIDGQHRVEAIREGNRDFPARLEPDQYPVIFLAHLDTKDGMVRTRRLFCDINKNAVAVSKGDKVIIDEDELPAIVTRRLFAEYPPFKKGKEIAVTEKIELVAKDGKEYFTSLLTVYTVCKKLKKLFRKPHGTIESAKENVVAFQKKIVAAFLDFAIEREPALRSYFVAHKTTPAKERVSNRNLVFRPIGLEMLARLYVHFFQQEKLPLYGWALENLTWENPGGVWDGTIWRLGKIQTKHKTAAFEFVLYLLHELPTSKVPGLLLALREIHDDENYELPERLKLPAKFEGK